MSFRTDNDEFEAWLADQCEVVKEDIAYKHSQMKTSAFVFLRATYFRWARKIGKWCPELMDAPQVLSVGDLHAENFGTWRDADGRLVWGVNDFDEAAVMPYLLDLVRLATSIRLAANLEISNKAVARALLEGYDEGLEHRSRLSSSRERPGCGIMPSPANPKPEKFWCEVAQYPEVLPPVHVAKELTAHLPASADKRRFHSDASSVRAVAALDGRVMLRSPLAGRPRVARGQGPGALGMALGPRHESDTLHFEKLANGDHRAPDPVLLRARQARLPAHRRRFPKDRTWRRRRPKKLQRKLVRAMGFDLASIHAAGSATTRAIRNDLRKRPRGWLNAAAKTAAAAVKRDYEDWRS